MSGDELGDVDDQGIEQCDELHENLTDDHVWHLLNARAAERKDDRWYERSIS